MYPPPPGQRQQFSGQLLARECSEHDERFEATGPNAILQIDADFEIHNQDKHQGHAHLIESRPLISPEGPSSVSRETEV